MITTIHSHKHGIDRGGYVTVPMESVHPNRARIKDVQGLPGVVR
jgi:hypothetical protein